MKGRYEMKKQKLLAMMMVGILFLASLGNAQGKVLHATPVTGEMTETIAEEEQTTTGNVKVDTVFLEEDGMLEPPTSWFHEIVFLYSSQAGQMETINLYNPETLETHTYITAIGYLMEYLGVNGKDKEYYNVRFQGGEYAIARADVTRFFYGSDIKSFPYYMNEGGAVNHYVEGNPLADDSWYLNSQLGAAPAWMEEGKKYYSFSGIYFVDDIEKLGNKNMNKNAVNKKYPYYAYYLYLPMRSKTSYSAAELNKAFDYLYQQTWHRNKVSKLQQAGGYFKLAESEYGINALLYLSIAINESAYGTSGYALEHNNLFGYNAVDSYPNNADKFNTVEDGILEVANLISWSYGDADYQEGHNYYGANLGTKSSGMNVKYASDPFWGEKAATHMLLLDQYLGGADFQKEGLAIAKQGAEVFWDEAGKTKAFTYKKSTSTLNEMYPIIFHNLEKKTEITMEPPYNESKVIGELQDRGGKFNWFKGYIKKNSYRHISDAKE